MKSFVRVVIRRADGRFLVLREPGRPFWNFPGGKVEPDEKPIDAAARELREETSIDASVTSLELIAQGVYDVLGTPWEGFFFFAHEAMGECVPERADPPVEWSWVTVAEMRQLDSLPGLLTPVAEKVDSGGIETRMSIPATISKTKSSAQPPALGERRAIGGYQPQYRFAARIILEKLRSGTLVSIKVADPDAGRLDDLQIVEQNRVDAYQVKWSRFSNVITFSDLTRADAKSPNLIEQLADGWKKLGAQNNGRRVVVHLVTNDRPSVNDALPGVTGGPNHFAAFIAECWVPKTQLSDASSVPHRWAPAWGALIAASRLTPVEFERFVKDCRLDFETPSPDRIASAPESPVNAREYDAWLEDLDAINLALYKIVADSRQIVELSRERFLRELRWKERTEFRHRHDFPEPSIPYQAVRQTVDELEGAITSNTGGYLLLLGSPGSGKSTLLTQTLRYRPERIVRYYAYVPDSLDSNLRRGESTNFLHDITLELERQGFRSGDSLPRADLDMLQSRFHDQLRQLGEDFRRTGRKTFILVDGLDHIAREQSPQRALLNDIPAPSSIPDGVFIILGSQTDQLKDLSRPVRVQLREPCRRIEMGRLPRAAVVTAISSVKLEQTATSEDIDRIFELSNGHPLALSYIINRLQRSRGKRVAEVIALVEPFNERIDAQYETHWLAIEEDRALVRLLALLARVRGALEDAWIEQWADAEAMFRLRRFDHYFRHEERGRRYFFHNSFRAFLLEKTRALPGVSSSSGDASLYRELAESCNRVSRAGRWQWDELHYRALAGDHRTVVELSTLEFFRAQFFEGRPLDAIQHDIRYSIDAAFKTGDMAAIARTILAGAEHYYREYNLGQVPVYRLLVALGQPAIAADHIRDGNRLRAKPVLALKASGLLASAGFKSEAELIFNLAEPHEVLCSMQPDEYEQRNANELLEAWIDAAPWFRSIPQILDVIRRLKRGEDRARQLTGADATRDTQSSLRFSLAGKMRESFRWDDFLTVVGYWDPVNSKDWNWLFWSYVHACRAAYHAGDHTRSGDMLNAAVSLVQQRTIALAERIALAEAFLRMSDSHRAKQILEGIEQPPLAHLGDPFNQDDFGPFWNRFKLNRALAALGDSRALSEIIPDAERDEDQPTVFFERQVVVVARLWGRALAGSIMSPTAFMSEASTIIRLLGQRPDSSARSSLASGGRPELCKLLIDAAKMHGPEVLEAIREAFDNEWFRTGRTVYYPGDLIRDVALPLYGAGAPRTWVAECLAKREECVDSIKEPYRRREAMVQQVDAYLAIDDKSAADAVFRKLLKSSLSISHKDQQLPSWIACAEKASLADPLNGEARFAWIAQYLPSIGECDEVLLDAADSLLCAVCHWKPAAGVKLLAWYWAQGIQSFSWGLRVLLEEITKVDSSVSLIVASIYKHLLLPLDPFASKSLVRQLGAVAATSRLSGDGLVSTHSEEPLHTLWREMEVSALPSTRRALWKALFADARTSGIGTANLDEPTNLPDSPDDDDDTSGQSTAKILDAFGEPRLTIDEIRTLSSSVNGVLQLLDRERTDSLFRWHEFISDLIENASHGEAVQLANAFAQKHGKYFQPWQVEILLCKRFRALGDASRAWNSAMRIFKNNHALGWRKFYDGGSRLSALGVLRSIKPEQATEIGLEVLASDLRSGGIDPVSVGGNLAQILCAISDNVPILEIWKEVDDYLKTLFGAARSVPPPDLETGSRSNAESLLFFAAEFLDCPVRRLAIGAQRLFFDFISSGHADAVCVFNCLLRDAAQPHNVMLAVLEAVTEQSPGIIDNFRENVAALTSSRHCGVRAACYRVLGSRPREDRKLQSPLPPVYQLNFKPRGRVHRIREDVATVPLPATVDSTEIIEPYRHQLDLLAERANIQPEALYERAVQIVTDRAPSSLTDGEEHLRRQLESIELKFGYRRPRPHAVRSAMFYAFGELVDAGRISREDETKLNNLLLERDPAFIRNRPTRRPGLVAPIAERSTDRYPDGSWTRRANVHSSALLTPQIYENGFVLAEETELSWLKGGPAIEKRTGVRVSGWPDTNILRFERDPLSCLCAARYCLTMAEYPHAVRDDDSLIMLQEGVQFETPAQRWLAFNPHIARRLGWKYDPCGLFRWVDANGETMVESQWWEDGFPLHRLRHLHDEVGAGWLVVASHAGISVIIRELGRLTDCVRVERTMHDGQEPRCATHQDLMRYEAPVSASSAEGDQ